MKLISIQVGLPREVAWRGRSATTAIFKEPVEGPVMLRTLSLDGDGQADLSVHGGLSKDVYAYPVEHYEYWRNELPDMELPNGMFGENFTTEGLLEKEVNIGDRFRIGEAEVVVTEPRLPTPNVPDPEAVLRRMRDPRRGPLDTRKALLDAERVTYEQVNGRVASGG